jgi:tetratricopeptide (TPR) repeat protein/predicted Ser/Thr protein kinase
VSSARPERLRELFAAASELDAREQTKFLDQACQGEPELRRSLEELLRFDEDAQGNTLWQRPALESEARRTANNEIPFDRLGPYRILKRLGVGGMGVVYLAEGDYDGVHKRVAIKAIPLAFDDDMLRRFQQERRILASLEHPNIARMLDAGTTPDGVPYLVMEYVDGMPLHRYAEEHRLRVNARLQLFRQICGAVSYAHRNLIVHRDLKPGNILVTEEGVPKLLDFGIARLLGESRADATVTNAMTPRYASPEQMAGRAITTASDIYSLGVILRELVPEPRGSDLDNVIAMALREEPERRYASAADFSEDVRRVQGRYPVSARPDRLAYRARRFISRRPWEVALTLSLVAVAAGAAMVALGQYRAANRRFQDVREVANSFLFEVYDAIGDQPGTIKARAMIAQRAQRYLDALARDRSNDRALQKELAAAYLKLGDMLGQPFAANLGDTAGALENYQKAAAILEGLAASGRPDAAVFLDLGSVYAKQGRIASRKGSFDEAVAAGERCVRAREEAVALDRSSREARHALVAGKLFLGMSYGEAAKPRNEVAKLTAWEALSSTALAEARQLSVEMPDDETEQLQVCQACQYTAYADVVLATSTNDRKYAARALSLFEEELHRLEQLYARDPVRFRRHRADAFADLSRGLLAAGDGARSESAAREGLRGFEEIAAQDPANYEAARDVFVAHWNVANAQAAQNRDASREFEAVVAGYEQVHRRNPEDRTVEVVVEARDWLAARALARGNRARAMAQYRKNIETIGVGSSPVELVSLALEEEHLGNAFPLAGKAQAAEHYARALALWEKLENAHQAPAAYEGKQKELSRSLDAVKR